MKPMLANLGSVANPDLVFEFKEQIFKPLANEMISPPLVSHQMMGCVESENQRHNK
jgi:hypothetical protein